MENLKEIDLLLMAVPEGIHDNAWVQTAIKMLRDIAEIAKENEPVAWCVSYEDASGCTIHSNPTMRKEQAECIASQAANHISLCNLYAFPPSTEQIENRVAEACAELCDSLYITENAAYEIRAGKWKEFIK